MIYLFLGPFFKKADGFRHWTVAHVRLFSDIQKYIGKYMHMKPTKIETCMYIVGA